MSTSAILCAECQNPWPQGAAVCPVCGSRVSHVGATGTHPARALAVQAAPTARRPRVVAPTPAASNGAPANGSAKGIATNGKVSNGTLAEAATALDAGAGLCGQTFVIERVLRRGGFCISYAARVTALEQSAVLQELMPPGCVRRGREVIPLRMTEAEFARIKTRYAAEARALVSFAHPGIVAARQVFEENNTLYLAMERAPGQSLQERVEEGGPLAWAQAVEVISQIGAMVVALHEAGLAHGDIRAANVSLSRAVTVEQSERASTAEYALRAMLNDWGLERWLEESYVVTGGAEAAASPASDVAGLAATLFFALTGQRPPVASHDAARALGLTQSPEEAVTQACPIPSRLAEAVLRGLERDTEPALTARAFLQLIQQSATPSATAPAPNRTPFDALLTGQKKPAPPKVPTVAVSDGTAANAVGRAAKSENLEAPATERRVEKRWVQDVALSVGGAILVGLAAWLLTTQTSNRPTNPPQPAMSITPQGDITPTPQANTRSIDTQVEFLPPSVAATALPQATPEPQANAPAPRPDTPQQAASQEVAPRPAAPRLDTLPTPAAPKVTSRTSTRAVTAPRRAEKSGAASSPTATTRASLPKPRRQRRETAQVEASSAPPRRRLRRAESSASRPQLEPKPRTFDAPELEFPPQQPAAPRLRARKTPRIRRRVVNRSVRRAARRYTEPGLPPSPSSAPAEAGLPPAP